MPYLLTRISRQHSKGIAIIHIHIDMAIKFYRLYVHTRMIVYMLNIYTHGTFLWSGFNRFLNSFFFPPLHIFLAWLFFFCCLKKTYFCCCLILLSNKVTYVLLRLQNHSGREYWHSWVIAAELFYSFLLNFAFENLKSVLQTSVKHFWLFFWK